MVVPWMGVCMARILIKLYLLYGLQSVGMVDVDAVRCFCRQNP